MISMFCCGVRTSAVHEFTFVNFEHKRPANCTTACSFTKSRHANEMLNVVSMKHSKCNEALSLWHGAISLVVMFVSFSFFVMGTTEGTYK